MFSNFQVGTVNIMSSSDGPLSAEQWAKLAADKIMYIGDKTEGPIKDQAVAFKSNIQKVVEYYITQAVQSHERYLLSRR